MDLKIICFCYNCKYWNVKLTIFVFNYFILNIIMNFLVITIIFFYYHYCINNISLNLLTLTSKG